MISVLPDEAKPITVTAEEVVALNAFGLVYWDKFNSEFRLCHDVNAAKVQRFLKAFRA